MNKRNKIIVSIVGITIVLLALLGITYAYYLTKIEGNTNTNSVSITTADLRIEYADGNGVISSDALTPGNYVGSENGKTFSVENKGNVTIEGYSVVLEYIFAEGVNPSVFERPEDFKITLTCESSDGSSCAGFSGTLLNQNMILTNNNIDAGEIHNYTLKVFYEDPGVDQSNDMGKSINMLVQIYRLSETSDVVGQLSDIDGTYAMKIQSKTKISPLIKNGNIYTFKFVGVEPGEHTLTLLDKDGTAVSTASITIKKGTASNVSSSEFTVTETEREIKLNTSLSGTSMSVSSGSVGVQNPYDNNKNTLAYYIINNAMIAARENSTEKTLYKQVPTSVPGKEGTKYNYKSELLQRTSLSNLTADVTQQSYYWTYGTGYTVNSSGGKITLTGVKTCKYDESGCISDLVNSGQTIYLANSVSNVISETNTTSTYTSSYGVYKLVSAPQASADSITLTAYYMENVRNSTERELSLTQDDYGVSYYYRGGAADNYINFAGKCWRIVRIQGDGSIKLIAEDLNATCTSSSERTGTFGLGKADFGYTSPSGRRYYQNYLNPTSPNPMVNKFKNFQNNTISEYLKYLKSGDWCYDDRAYSYDSTTKTYTLIDNSITSTTDPAGRLYYYTNGKGFSYGYNLRRKEPTLKCDGTIFTQYNDSSPMYVATLTADEVAFAGVQDGWASLTHYLYHDFSYWWTMTPARFSLSFGDYEDCPFSYQGNELDSYYNVKGLNDSEGYQTRPSIILKPGTLLVSGSGFADDPYIVNGSN